MTLRRRKTSCRLGRSRLRAGRVPSHHAGKRLPHECTLGSISGASSRGAWRTGSRSRRISDRIERSGRNPVRTTTSSTSSTTFPSTDSIRSDLRRRVDQGGAKPVDRSDWPFGNRGLSLLPKSPTLGKLILPTARECFTHGGSLDKPRDSCCRTPLWPARSSR